MTNSQLVELYRWLRRVARGVRADSGESPVHSVRRAAKGTLGRQASQVVGPDDPDTDGLDDTQAWAVRYLCGVVREVLGQRAPFDPNTSFAGYHHEIVRIRSTIGELAASPHPVLLIGERGTGKGQLMRAIHRELNGKPRPGMMHLLSLAATPPELADSELFGHEQGAFTGATAGRLGVFRSAAKAGEALFLDDIGECPKPVQSKLLSALDDGLIRPVGSDVPVDIGRGPERKLKIFAAIQPEALGNLRPDVRDRLWFCPQSLPPLRRRGLDVLLLADLALDACPNDHSVRPRVTPEVRRHWLAERWPGNVRELVGVVNRAVNECRGRGKLDLAAVSAARKVDELIHGNDPGHQDGGLRPFDAPGRLLTLEEASERHVREALRRTGGNIAQAARLLGMPRSTLNSRLNGK